MTTNDEIFLPKCKLPYYSKLCCSTSNTIVNTRPSAGVQSANMTNSLLQNSVSSTKSLRYLSNTTTTTTTMTTYRSTTSSTTYSHHRRTHRYENNHYYQTVGATTRIKMSSKHKRILDALIKKV